MIEQKCVLVDDNTAGCRDEVRWWEPVKGGFFTGFGGVPDFLARSGAQPLYKKIILISEGLSRLLSQTGNGYQRGLLGGAQALTKAKESPAMSDDDDQYFFFKAYCTLYEQLPQDRHGKPTYQLGYELNVQR